MDTRGKVFQLFSRHLHTRSVDGPSNILKKKISLIEKQRKKKNPKKNQLFVEVPESKSYLDTATLPMILTAVGGALFAKLLMMHDDSKSQEMIERKIKNAPAGQGTVRMLSREEWEDIKDVRPRTPFESKLARPKARLRTGEPIRMDDFKDWTIDVLTDAFTRVEENVRYRSK
ncbi:hypothetical protein DCAR_0309880 [Daucus carota subsp. sativus]|uniref:Uncharacterized protein n=2 Tax=Daucus carota subsp. sativus TaxID=79200 RepID=A0AAF0WJS8_DAUCS|nr:PREDICTED: uncharacterized protein LOC108211558 isoform X1 [Daucus carota subsp. sativus]XP_017238679.1 PREDICTED: uncharacterized protein LOC108211558 isoform X1 [Daucus carota subsp. sativus]WOG90636.1 hypothetical protein DCAR_0309880 [Daucus carota subsp. sativus]